MILMLNLTWALFTIMVQQSDRIRAKLRIKTSKSSRVFLRIEKN
jgi:hypothetical protein